MKVKKLPFKNIEKFVKEYRVAENQKTRAKRQQKMGRVSGVVQRVDHGMEGKLAFAVQIRSAKNCTPEFRRILKIFRLHQLQTGVFLKLDARTAGMLREVAPLVAFGEPSKKSVEELIRKRGFGKVDKKRLPIGDNQMVEEALGQYGIICIEDLVDEIYNVGPNFKACSSFIWPFKLSKQSDGYVKKMLDLNDVGPNGHRGKSINKLIQHCI
jgi:60S ribosomal protein uL30